jgi:hypothetical protein
MKRRCLGDEIEGFIKIDANVEGPEVTENKSCLA